MFSRRLIVLSLALGLLAAPGFQAPISTPGPGPVSDLAPAPAPPPAPAPAPTPVAPSIVGATSVPCYGFARLELRGDYTSAAWLCFPDTASGAGLVSTYTAPKGHAYLFGGKPGVYWVGVFVTTASGVSESLQSSVTIQPVPGPPQPPPPGPTPGPSPPPAPTPPAPVPVGRLWAVGVYDTAGLLALPVPVRDIRDSVTIGPALAPTQTTWRSYDVGAPALAGPGWQAALKATGIPALIVIDAAGKVVSAGPMPADEASVITFVKSLRGAS